MSKATIPLRIGSGWGDLRFGDSIETVRDRLESRRIKFDASIDPFRWFLEDEGVDLVFEVGTPTKLVQIETGHSFGIADDDELMDTRLDEALLVLGVTSYDDTLWSAVDYTLEYEDGKALIDAERPNREDSLKLLDTGTLWIRSRGLGLVMDRGKVSELLLRDPTNVPKVGCGPLNATVLTEATSDDLDERIDRYNHLRTPRKIIDRPKSPLVIRLVLFALGLAISGIPIAMLVQDFLAWQKAEEVTGLVVALTPEGPFPEILTIEYPLPDQTFYRVDVPFQYTAARKLGEEVPILFRKEDPKRGLTRSQIGDECWSFSPIILAGCIPASLFLLGFAFPNMSRTIRYT